MKAELLAPAGSYSKFLTAMHFGADAVYVGGKNFSLRTFADNFTPDELRSAVSYAHSLGKKVYVTANVLARNADFEKLPEYFAYLQEIGADAAIISDPGAVYVAKKFAPNLPIHLSTQANTTNKYSVKFWKEQGISRVILARELSIAEIAEMHEFVPEKTPTLVHIKNATSPRIPYTMESVGYFSASVGNLSGNTLILYFSITRKKINKIFPY